MSTKQNNKMPRWIRFAIPSALIIVWFAVAAIGGPYFGKISDVASNDLSTFLPESAESTEVNNKLSAFRDSDVIPAVVVFEHRESKKITEKNIERIEKSASKIEKIEGVSGEISPAIIADDKKAAYVVVPLESDGEFKTIIPALSDTFSPLQNKFEYKVTGPASFAYDLQKAFSGIDVTLLLVALSVVFLILLVVYRSPLLPFLVLICSMGALTASIFVVWNLANADIIQLNGQVQGILFILVIGATTDYSLLYIARYREELMNHGSAWQATKATLRASFEPIVAAGGTVIVGLMCLLLSDLESNKALGPVGGIGITLAIASALTFLPALLLIFGRYAFWPRQPKKEKIVQQSYTKRHPAWAKVGVFVQRYPRRIWVTTTLVLLIACAGIFQLKADGVPQSELALGYSEAREGQTILDEHFPSGSGSPAYVLADKDDVKQTVRLLDSDPGVSSVVATATDSPSDTKPVGKAERELKQALRKEIKKNRAEQLDKLKKQIQQQTVNLPPMIAEQAYMQAAKNIPSVSALVKKAYPFKGASIKVVDEKVLLQATLNDAADSDEARETVVRLRDSLKQSSSTTLVGGTTAVQYDTNQASIRDRTILIPLILVAITIILIVLLRSLVAPLILLLTTVLSFGTTMGIAAVLFNQILGFPGADPSVVLFGFVFLVALGIDYNIFLMTRVREETIKSGVRKGTIKGLVVTGGVITSAGIVLAATFAALGVIPILFLVQLAFIVAFGVLLDTIIVRSLFVPALTLELGEKMWWPSKIGRKK